MKRAYDRIAKESYRETDEVDIVRAYEISEAIAAHPDRQGATRAHGQMPYDSMKPICDSETGRMRLVVATQREETKAHLAGAEGQTL